MSKRKEPCPAPDCTKIGDFARGFCSHHYLEFRAACKMNGSWYRGCEPPSPEIEHWQYENEQGEKELAEIAEQEIRAEGEEQK